VRRACRGGGRGADDPAGVAGREQYQAERRHHEHLGHRQRAYADRHQRHRGQPAEADGEDQHQSTGEHELRDRHHQQQAGGDHPVAHPAAAQARGHAHQQGGRDQYGGGEPGKQRGVAESLRQHVRDRAAARRDAQVAAHDPREPVEIALSQWPVQAEPCPGLGHHLGSLRAQPRGHWIARQQIHADEHHDRQQCEHPGRENQPEGQTDGETAEHHPHPTNPALPR
jgi:hypothetical protein